MYVLATSTFTDRSKLAPLVKAEVERVHQLRHEGVIAQAFRRSDGGGTVLILQVASIDEARDKLGQLPFSQAGLMAIEYAELVPL
jgi:uncharacterized protein YciI